MKKITNSLAIITIAICVVVGCILTLDSNSIYSGEISLPIISECPYTTYPDAYETSSFNPLHQ